MVKIFLIKLVIICLLPICLYAETKELKNKDVEQNTNNKNVEDLSGVRNVYIDPFGEDKWNKVLEEELRKNIKKVFNEAELRDEADAVIKISFRPGSLKERDKTILLVNRKGKILWLLKNFKRGKGNEKLIANNVVNKLEKILKRKKGI